jgi:hypothetical protein
MKAIDLQVERSLALHAAVAERLGEDPEILARACRKLDEWLSRGGRSTPLWMRWREILDRPVDEIAAFLTERSQEAAWLRKASPFAGVLPPEERLRILRHVRARFDSAA